MIMKIFMALILFIMLFASIKDIKYKQVSVLVPILCAGVSAAAFVYGIVTGNMSVREFVISLVPGAILVFFGFITRGKIGYGDGLILMSIGPAFGTERVWMGIMAALMLSGITSIVLLTVKRADRNTEMAFIPFMTIGMGVMLFA